MTNGKAYYDQLTKYNNYSKNKKMFEGQTKRQSIQEQIKSLFRLLSSEDQQQLITALNKKEE